MKNVADPPAGDGVIAAAFSGGLGTFALDVAFSAPLRGVTALFGPSGCGKTTLLRCIAGLQHLPGSLHIDGEVWQNDAQGVFLKPHRRAVGYVFQEPSLFDHLSVRGNLQFGARRVAGGVTASDGAASHPNFDEVVGLLDIGGLLDRSPAALSGGERQRVAIGRALLSRPRLLLMDEPLNALDRNAKAEILPYLEALNAALTLPIIYVSHDISEVARLSDRIVVLADGSKRVEGPTDEIMARLDLQPGPARIDKGVALIARLRRHDRAYLLSELELCGQTLTVPLFDAPVGSDIQIRICADDIMLATTRPRGVSGRNMLKGTITEIVEDEETPFAEITVDIGGAAIRARALRASVSELRLAPNRAVFALINSIGVTGKDTSAP